MSLRTRFGIMAALFTAVFSLSAHAAIPASEHDALIALYNSTGGSNWTNSSGWNGPTGTECAWFGVVCNDSASNVTGLALGNNNLSGTLPSFGGLSALQAFFAQDNHLIGAIPSLAGSSNLQQFYVQNNQLTGTIPALGGLANLVEFYVNGNQLTGTLPALGGLINLSIFDVDTNQLTGAIPALAGLAKLSIFDVENNQLTGSIPPLDGLINLSIFAVDTNGLTGAIPSLSGLPGLQHFSAGYNGLTGAIPPLGGLTNLSYFYVASNQLTDPIPQLAGLSSLAIFDASFNKITGSIPLLSGLGNLQQVYLGFNQLSGSIPPLDGLGNLQDLVVGDNLLTGSIPSLSGLGNLQVFNAGNNQLTGGIPSLSGLTNLQSFYADSDQLTGSIPQLAGLSQLAVFSVARNQLTGAIPPLAGLASLGSFDASFNQLSGPIPSLSGLGQLQTVYLGFNQITGSIPPLTGLGKLQEFVVDDNQLSGSLPTLTGLSSLQSFNAETNQLTGSIPALSGLNNLSYFSVTRNQLTGSIPALSGLINLSLFDASYNQIAGSIPSLSGLGNLQKLYLGFNQLTGSIPALAGLVNLQDFAVDDNRLSGLIPSLSGLGNLQGFLAATNQLTGTIPELTGLSNLQYFEVGNNRLSGAIPAVPSPDNLASGLSSLCPNALTPTPDPGWDAATGLMPWYSTCAVVESKTASNAPTTKDSTNVALSQDGTIKVFQSQEADLVAGNTNAGGQDIYSVSPTGQPVLENLDSTGHQLIGTASLPAVSPDGNVVAFLFIPAAAKQAKDVTTGQMFAGARGQPKHQVDMGMGGVPPNGSANGAPSLSSAHGTNQLVFCSVASNLVPGDGNNAHDIFLVDPLNPAIAAQRVSVDSSGNEISGDSCEPKLSSDGTKLVFSVSAPSLYGTPVRQVVRKDLGAAAKELITGQMLLISSSTTGTGQGANADSSEPSISADGSVVAFTSQANNLDGLGTPAGGKEAFVSLAQSSDNAASRTLKRLRNGDGSVPDGSSQHPQLSDDGTTAVIQTGATNLLGTAPNQCGTMTITTNFFSIATLGSAQCTTDGMTVNQSPAISGDGTATGFDSNAPQSNNSTNRNTYAQGIGVYPGTGIPNLSGDFSGQWYDPSQSGQGLVIDVTNPDADNRRVMILTWFVYSNGQPTWVQGVGIPQAGTASAANTVVVQMNPVGIFHGVSFPLGEAVASATNWGSITLTFNDANTGSMSWTSSYPGFNSGTMPIKHFLPVALPASDPVAAQIKACYSGNWKEPAKSGHGFEFEVVPSASGPLLAVDWFAYAPTGAPVWLFGAGPIVGNSAQMPLGLIDGAGAQFPPNFDPTRITKHTWGTATFTFNDAGHAKVVWNSTIAGYGSGQLDLQPTLGVGLLDRRRCQ